MSEEAFSMTVIVGIETSGRGNLHLSCDIETLSIVPLPQSDVLMGSFRIVKRGA